jgi:hypothetical protein
MDKVQKHNSFNTNTPSSASYKKHEDRCVKCKECIWKVCLNYSKLEHKFQPLFTVLQSRKNLADTKFNVVVQGLIQELT